MRASLQAWFGLVWVSPDSNRLNDPSFHYPSLTSLVFSKDEGGFLTKPCRKPRCRPRKLPAETKSVTDCLLCGLTSKMQQKWKYNIIVKTHNHFNDSHQLITRRSSIEDIYPHHLCALSCVICLINGAVAAFSECLQSKTQLLIRLSVFDDSKKYRHICECNCCGSLLRMYREGKKKRKKENPLVWQVSLEALAPAAAPLIRQKKNSPFDLHDVLPSCRRRAQLGLLISCTQSSASLHLNRLKKSYFALLCTWISFCSLCNPFIKYFVTSLQTIEWP